MAQIWALDLPHTWGRAVALRLLQQLAKPIAEWGASPAQLRNPDCSGGGGNCGRAGGRGSANTSLLGNSKAP